MVKIIGVAIGARDILSDLRLKDAVKSFRFVYFFYLSFGEINNDPLLCKNDFIISENVV